MVLSTGTVNVDLVMAIDAPLESGDSLIARRLLRTSGGRAANAAVMARRLGTPARLFGCVGTGELGEQALAGPARAGVDVSAVRRVAGDPGIATILVAPHGEKTMVFAPGANEAFAEADAERVAAATRGAADGSVLAADSELSPGPLEHAFAAARAQRRATVLDPTRTDRVTDRLIELADHVTPNADEAERLTGVEIADPAGAVRAARALRQRGARHAHVRLRGGGCVTLWADGQLLVTVPDIEPVDSTGAGDAFVGTLASALVEGRELADAVRRAAAAAACSVGVLGPQESYPDRPTLEAVARRVRVEPLRASAQASRSGE